MVCLHLNHRELTPHNRMGGQNSKNSNSAASSSTFQPSQRLVQNFLLLWVDALIDDSNKVCQNTLNELRSVVNDVKMMTTLDQCIQFLSEIKKEKIFLITSGSLGEHLIPDIHTWLQLDAIYIFVRKKSVHESWANTWSKIKGVYTDIKPICQVLQQAIK